MPKHKSYQSILFFLLFLALIFLVFLNFLDRNTDTSTETVQFVTLPCSNTEETTILKEASAALDPNNADTEVQLQAVVDKIMSFENYQNDAYCLHIVTTKYIYDSDYSQAKKYLDLLDQKLDESNTDTLAYKVNFMSVAELHDNVDFLKSKIDEIETNNPYGEGQ